MKPKIDFISLGVQDIPRSLAFYRALFDSPDDCIRHGENHVAISMEGGLNLVLYSMAELAKFPRTTPLSQGGSPLIISSLTSSREEVQPILDRVAEAGGTVVKAAEELEYGYFAYFEDPDGHVWEIGCD